MVIRSQFVATAAWCAVLSITGTSCAQENVAATPQAAALQAAAPAVVVEPVSISVAAGARQGFAGFGTSLGNWGGDYQKLTPVERAALSQMMWRDLKMKTLRMWFNLNRFAPTRDARDMTEFRRGYVDSGIIADARRMGVTTLLLAPDNPPEYMTTPREGGGRSLKDEEIDSYTAVIADFIKRLRDETKIRLDVTGIKNEPNDRDRIAPEQMARVITSLRAALDARGLQAVKIIAPESANVDGIFYDTLDRIKADPRAWNAIEGIASHSYNMAATDEGTKRIAGTNKTYWMTEASANGAEVPGDALQGVSLATRFLSDMNHGVTHWIHFLGFETPDPNDNATRIVAYTSAPLKTTVFQKYFYYRQLANTFDIGARFRDSQSTLDGDMVWTYGKKARVTSASARNPDGSWGVGIADFTAPGFNDDPNDNSGYANGYKARSFDVTIQIDELKNVASLPFQVRRSGTGMQDKSAGSVILKNGRATLRINPLELVTLRSAVIRAPKTIRATR